MMMVLPRLVSASLAVAAVVVVGPAPARRRFEGLPFSHEYSPSLCVCSVSGKVRFGAAAVVVGVMLYYGRWLVNRPTMAGYW